MDIKVVLPSGELDVKEGFGFGLNYSNGDVQEISKRDSNYSKTITLVGSKNNNKIMGGLFDVNADFTFFNPNLKTDAKILVNSSTVIEGYLRLKKIDIINKDFIEGDSVEYQCVISSQSVDFFSKIQDKDLTELDFTAYNHLLTKATIVDSWTNTAADVYTYPLMYGNSNAYSTNDFKPAIFKKAYLRRMAKDAGYSLTGSLMDESTDEGSQFAKEIIPFNGELPQITPAEQLRRKFRASSTGGQSVISGTVNNTHWTGISGVSGSGLGTVIADLLNIDDDSTLPNFDNASNFSTVNSTWTVDADGSYGVFGEFNIDIDWTAADDCDLDITSRDFWGSTTPSSAGLQQKAYNIGIRMLVDGIVKGVATKSYQHLPEALLSGSNLTQDTLPVNFASIYLLAGQEVSYDVILGSKIFQPNFLGTYVKYIDGGGSDVVVDYDFDITSSLMYNQVTSGVLVDGDAIDLTAFIPKNIKQSEVLTDIIKTYNAYITLSPDASNTLVLETRDTYFNRGSILDWTDKKDYTQKDSIKLLSELQNKEILFSHTKDDDFFNTEYSGRVANEVYGQEKVIFNNEFIKGTKKITSPFSPTPLVYNSLNPVAIIPAISVSAPETNPRTLYFGGVIDCINSGSWTFEYSNGSGTLITDTYTTYPYAGHYDNPITPSIDINFGDVPYEFYTELENTTKGTLYNKWWKNYVEQLDEGKQIDMYFDLTESDIDFIKDNLNSKIFVRDSYYRINKVVDYNPILKKTTKVELLKIKDGVSFVKNNLPISFEDTNPAEDFAGARGTDDNISYSEDTLISGSSNRIGTNSNNSTIKGDNNFIGNNSTNSIISGNNNTIESELNNAFIIGTDNVTLTESNTGYISGVFYRNGLADSVQSEYVFSDLITARNASELVKGVNYYCSDLGFSFLATAVNSISMITENVINVVEASLYSSLGIWVTNKDYSVDDLIIWGGQVWKCTATAGGYTPVDDFTLNGSYYEVETTSSYYDVKTLSILYSEEDLLIIESSDDKGNIVRSKTQENHYFSDWNDDRIYNNITEGFFNNDVNDISNNICKVIKNNVIDGDITYNRNNGDITDNTNAATFTLDITDNTNNGGITFNNATASVVIDSNINNGNIGTGTLTNRAANVTDTTVNK